MSRSAEAGGPEVPDELLAVAERLYAGTPEAFTPARDAAAKDCTRDGDKALAARVKKLKRPSVAAWALNRLVRRETDQIAGVLDLADSLRAAAEALDGEELRALTRQRRQLTAALTTTARTLAREEGVRLSGPVLDQVEGVLTAAMLDPVAAQVVRTGRLVTTFTSTGVSEVDVAAVVAVPEALGVAATPLAAPDGPADSEQAGPTLRVVRDDRLRREAAEEALEEARHAVQVAQEGLAEVEGSVATLQARRLQLQAEAEELRRSLAALESQVDDVDDELEEAGAAREDAEEALAEARRAEEDAEEELVGLEGS